jgi:hypothetical protein
VRGHARRIGLGTSRRMINGSSSMLISSCTC